MSGTELPVWDIREDKTLSDVPRALWPRDGTDTPASHTRFAEAALRVWESVVSGNALPPCDEHSAARAVCRRADDAWGGGSRGWQSVEDLERARDTLPTVQHVNVSGSGGGGGSSDAPPPPPPRHAVMLVRIHVRQGGHPPLQYIIKIAEGARRDVSYEDAETRGRREWRARLLAHDATMMRALAGVPCFVRYIWSMFDLARARGVLVETYVPPLARGVSNLMSVLHEWETYLPQWEDVARLLRHVWRIVRSARQALPEWQHNDLKTDNIMMYPLPPAPAAATAAASASAAPHGHGAPAPSVTDLMPVLIDFEFAHARTVPCPYITRAPDSIEDAALRTDFALDAHACSALDVHLLLTDMLRVIERTRAAGGRTPPWAGTLRQYMDDVFPRTLFPSTGLTPHLRLGAALRDAARFMDAELGVDTVTRAAGHAALCPPMRMRGE